MEAVEAIYDCDLSALAKAACEPLTCAHWKKMVFSWPAALEAMWCRAGWEDLFVIRRAAGRYALQFHWGWKMLLSNCFFEASGIGARAAGRMTNRPLQAYPAVGEGERTIRLISRERCMPWGDGTDRIG